MAQHGIKEHSHGGLVPIQTRNERPRSTSIEDFAEVSRLQEIWRYLPIDKLKGLTQSVIGELSDAQVELKLAAGVTANWVDTTAARVGQAGLPEDRIAAIAWTNASKTLVVNVPNELEQSEPSFVVVRPNSDQAAAAHVLINVGTHARATIVLDHAGLGVLGENVEIVLGDESELNFVTIQDWEKGSTHVSSQFAKLGRNANLRHIVVSL
ncbi:MAG: Fe-S cluster assembly protein SufD, partial [Actinomycetota bacterium]